MEGVVAHLAGDELGADTVRLNLAANSCRAEKKNISTCAAVVGRVTPSGRSQATRIDSDGAAPLHSILPVRPSWNTSLGKGVKPQLRDTYTSCGRRRAGSAGCRR